MTTNKIEVNEIKRECFCQSKGFRKFLITALGSFVGVFCALSLFAALHKPPVPPCPYGKMMMRPPMHRMYHMNKFDKYQRFERGPRGDFQRKIEKRNFERKTQENIRPVNQTTK